MSRKNWIYAQRSTNVCATIGRFELFLDLLYVALLSNFADALAEDITGAQLAKYVVSRDKP